MGGIICRGWGGTKGIGSRKTYWKEEGGRGTSGLMVGEKDKYGES